MDLTNFSLADFEASAGKAADLLRTLGNEKRLLILCQLGADEIQAGALQEPLGLSQSALSQHLAILREAGVVATRREGQTIWYRIADPAAMQVIATLAAIFCPDKAAKRKRR
ncbi:MAG: transcriptional regulator [Alphaproteobacteria bacterium]|nr:MAG: transcriptional regulator [Alphaproteobacteria bacterium]